MDLAAMAERKRKDGHLCSWSDNGMVFHRLPCRCLEGVLIALQMEGSLDRCRLKEPLNVCSSFHVGRNERETAHTCACMCLPFPSLLMGIAGVQAPGSGVH